MKFKLTNLNIKDIGERVTYQFCNKLVDIVPINSIILDHLEEG
jgi:hypothetical protein